MADLLLNEIDEALRHDRMVALWHEWRKPLFYGAIALILGTAGASVWRDHREKVGQAAMETLTDGRSAYSKGDFAGAAASFHTVAGENGGALNDIARLWEGRALLAGGKKDEAVVVFAGLVAKPEGSDLLWRDLACLRLAGID